MSDKGFIEKLNLRVAATIAWRDQLVKDKEKMIKSNKKKQLQGYIDILSFWIDIGEYVQKTLKQ